MAKTSLLRVIGGTTALLAAIGTAAVAPATADVGPRIIGGEETTTEENPFVVALFYPGDALPHCGGSIVAPNKILTAGHCVDGDTPEEVEVVAGRTTMSTDEGTVAHGTAIWIHPDWVGGDTDHDIAVVTLDTELAEAPIAVASTEDSALYEAGADSTVYGWGWMEDSNPSDTLRKVTVPVTADDTCAASYPDKFHPETMVCAGLKEGGKDACQHDSGGPLEGVAADGTRKVIGIVAWGEGCALPDKYGVYTRVSTYYDLIQEQLAG